ncbi:MAG: hypothetical protein AAFR44_08645 [Pseudomonadota bacterium]
MESIEPGKLIFAGVGLALIIGFVLWVLLRKNPTVDDKVQSDEGGVGGDVDGD